jgi:hypothetical protein
MTAMYIVSSRVRDKIVTISGQPMNPAGERRKQARAITVGYSPNNTSDTVHIDLTTSQDAVRGSCMAWLCGGGNNMRLRRDIAVLLDVVLEIVHWR